MRTLMRAWWLLIRNPGDDTAGNINKARVMLGQEPLDMTQHPHLAEALGTGRQNRLRFAGWLAAAVPLTMVMFAFGTPLWVIILAAAAASLAYTGACAWTGWPR